MFLLFFSRLQLVDFLEANEIQRPVTIRTNTLKTRRRDLAQVTVGLNVKIPNMGLTYEELSYHRGNLNYE